MSQLGPIRAVQDGVIQQIRAKAPSLKVFTEVPPRTKYPYIGYNGYAADRFSAKQVEGWDGTLEIASYAAGAGSQMTDAATDIDAVIEALSITGPGEITIAGYTITNIQCTSISRPERDYQADVAQIVALFRLRIMET